MGNKTPEIRASVEDVLLACQNLIANKAVLCHDAGKESPQSAEFARACFEQYAEGIADALDSVSSGQTGASMRTFARLKAAQLQDCPTSTTLADRPK